MSVVNTLKLSADAITGRGALPVAAFTMPSSLRTGLKLALMPGYGALDDIGPDGVAAALVGAPSEITGGFACDASNYLNGIIADTASITMAIIGRRRTTGATGYGGNSRIVNSASVLGVGFYSGNAGTTMAFQGARTGLGAAASVASITSSLDAWGLYMGRTATAQNTVVNNLTAGTSTANTTATGTARVTNSQSIRAGALPDPAYTGGSDTALLMVWKRYLGDAELPDFTSWARAYATALGLTV